MAAMAIAAVFGLMVGSFANVCVHRLPRGESIIRPRSHCPRCRHAIAWYDNIPVISFLWLRRHCRHCQAIIPWRYPLLELSMASVWVYLVWHFGVSVQLLPALTLASMLWMLAFIDIEYGLLPDALTLPGIAAGIAFNLWLGDPLASVVGAAGGYASFWLVAKAFLWLRGMEGLGYGDFKLLAMLGAFFGWQALPFIVFAAAASGAMIGGLYLIISRQHARIPIPFGPYLAAAGMLWLLWGPGWLQAYLDWVLA